MSTTDLIFETLYQLWTGRPYESGVPMTKAERGRINKAAVELRAVGATPDEIRARWSAAAEKWKGVSITPQTIVMNWSSLASAPVTSLDAWRAKRAQS